MFIYRRLGNARGIFRSWLFDTKETCPYPRIEWQSDGEWSMLICIDEKAPPKSRDWEIRGSAPSSPAPFLAGVEAWER